MPKLSQVNFFLIFFIGLSSISHVHGQQFQEFFPPFYANGKKLLNATAGGIRNGQFSNIDFNNDGIKDLYVFDKAKEKVICFLGVDDGEEFRFEYAPQYQSIFPKMYNFSILYDFNKDGIEDIFALTTRSVSGINVWRGKRDNNGIYFEEMIFRTDGFNSIPIKIEGQQSNLYNSLLDIPAITDVDFDGDTDILSFDDSGTHVVYFKNYAIENGFGIDTFDMFREDLCFGKFYESAFDQQLFLSDNPDECRMGKLKGEIIEGGPRHSGSTLLAFDGDCDNDVDLLLGDLANYGLTYAVNGGTKEKAWITQQDIHFPSNDEPVFFPLFHGVFLVDVNNDGLKDLLVSPNEFDGGNNIDHIWCYINKGTNCSPIFELQTKNFMVETMVSIGGRSDLTTMDINGDGLLDIILAGNGVQVGDNDKVDKLFYYKNTGTKSSPEFTLEDNDYLSMDTKSEFAGSLSPCSGDIDGDGDIDLLVGDADGQLYLFENKSGKDNPVIFENFIYPYKDIFIGTAAKPFLYDLTGDGLNDLIVGEQNNSLNYFVNIGQIGEANFSSTATSSNYGGAFPLGNNSFLWFNSPSFFKTKDDKTNAIIGFTNGTISTYEKTIVNGIDKLVRTDSSYQDYNFGIKTTNEIVDIDNDGFYDLIVGSHGGGLNFYHTEFSAGTTSSTEIAEINKLELYPNPVRDHVTITNSESGVLYIYNNLGLIVKKQDVDLSNNKINCSDLSSGFYIIKMIGENNKLFATKILKL